MKCPRDGSVLASVQLLGLQLDKCHQCDGIWFDRGELERLRDAKAEEAEETLERKYGNPRVQAGAVREYMRCPRCGDARLLRSTYTYLSQVSIDRCERCQGIWLDDGELDAIIGEKKKLDQIESSGTVKAFFRVIDRLTGRKGEQRAEREAESPFAPAAGARRQPIPAWNPSKEQAAP